MKKSETLGLIYDTEDLLPKYPFDADTRDLIMGLLTTIAGWVASIDEI